jgi:VCBS repeat-containing protein
VLANDGDVDNDPLRADLVDGPAHGTLALAADGSFVYTPAANFNGADGFTYRASDGTATSGITRVDLTVGAVDDAPVARDDDAAVMEFASVGGNVIAGGSGRDSDLDGDALTVIAVAAAGLAGTVGTALAGAHGTLTLAPDGSSSYPADHAAPLAAGATESDVFTYTVSDGHGGSDSAALTVTITGSATGTGGDDDLVGTGGDDTLKGESGDDTVHAGSGDDLTFGGSGDDQVLGGGGTDDARGGSGDDWLIGNGGDDVLWGRSGNDILSGRPGDDALHGAGGNDRLYGGSGDDHLSGGTGVDRAAGGAGDDTVFGNGGNDVLGGGSGNDTLAGGCGNDRMAGAAGNDTLSGCLGHDRLGGGGGNDVLVGGGDNDVLDGGAGHDVLTGGGGRDTFVFDSALTGERADRITDFTVGSDRIELSHAVFGALATGRLAAADFSADGTAHTADQHVLYNPHNGWLSYDADGNGGPAVHFATLGHGLHLVAADFLVVA